jgi:uncharacterized membrane protein
MLRAEENVEINAPIEVCYKIGIAFEEYPRFLNAVQSVRSKGAPNVWHWAINGPNNQILEWDVEVVGEKHQNQVISWRTLRQGDIAHSGAIIFKPLDSSRTAVQMVIEYTPASEAFLNWKNELYKYGKSIANSFLQSFKNFVEASIVHKT